MIMGLNIFNGLLIVTKMYHWNIKEQIIKI